jgi:hypothetical protein
MNTASTSPESEKSLLAAAALKSARESFVSAIAAEDKAAQGIAECQSAEAKLADTARPDDAEAVRAISELRTKRELFERDRAAAAEKVVAAGRPLQQAIAAYLGIANQLHIVESSCLYAEIRKAEARAREPFAAAEQRLSSFKYALRDNSGNEAARTYLLRNSERLLTAWQEFSAA